jgi:hypothetical protein
MKKITDVIATENEEKENYVVNGEGCLDDCKVSWQSSAMGCGHNAWLSSER